MEGLRQDTRLVVQDLERQVGRLRAGMWFLTLLLLGAVGFLGYQHLHPKAAPAATTLRVRGLVVEDEHGVARVLLGAPGLRLLDGQGRERGGFQVQEDGGTLLNLNDRQGAPAFRALSDMEPGATVALTNPRKDTLLLSTTQGPTLQLRRDGRVVLKQPYDAPELR